jgi:hypothetical protein
MRYLYVVAGIGILVTGGALHGYWTGRWTAAASVEKAAARLAEVPRTVGDWKGTDLELGARERQMAGGAGYVLRRYVHGRTNAAVTVYLICGRPGPVAVHTPDVCYEGAGYTTAGGVSSRSIPLEGPLHAAEFKSLRAERDAGTSLASALRVFWSWNAGGKWQAPAYPRVAFARHQVLYKLYVIESLGGDGESAGEGAATQFIRVLLPELQKCLYPEAKG